MFVSVEGECSRVGEVTAFVELANGPYVTPDEAVGRVLGINGGRFTRLVVDVCEVTYLDWREWVELFCEAWRAAGRSDAELILETRGEKAPLTPMATYLLVTPGTTQVNAALLDTRTDDAKTLLHCAEDLDIALEELAPYAAAGLRCYIFPRLTGAPLKACFDAFVASTAAFDRRLVRMMLLEHLHIGIL
jgi:hypothetical protein